MYSIREYKKDYEQQLNNLAVRAFNEYREDFSNWPDFKKQLKKFSELSFSSQLILALSESDKVIGAVAYVPAYIVKAPHFPENTPIIRMLVVDPEFRGNGIGKVLTQECLLRAKKEKCTSIALHTSKIMKIALPMYLKMGFTKKANAPDVNGVKYSVYQKRFI